MGYCPKCGSYSQGAYCSNCGTEMKNTEQSKKADASPYYTNSETASNQPASQQNLAVQPDPSQYKMGFHKFMVNFMLWAWAALCLLNCLAALDFSGISCLAYGALAVAFVYVRFQLARFKTNAPKKFLYTIIAYALMSIIADPSTASGAVIFIGAWGIGSWRYYASRSELFVN